MRGSIKANTTDRYLQPIRNQIAELVQPGANVIDFGCGNGDLLFKLSDKINSGIGLDISVSLISYATNRKNREGTGNLDFKLIDLRTKSFPKTTDYSIACLFFHVIPWNKSIDLLNEMIEISETIIICGFSKPKNWKQKFLLWVDQFFSGHYSHYKSYRSKDNMEGLLQEINKVRYSCYDTFDPVIKIYKITKHNNSWFT